MSCSTATSIFPDKEFDKYKDRYKELGIIFKEYLPNDFESRVESSKIYFSNLKNSEMGRCYLFFNEIYVDREIWNSLSEESRQELIFHELTHCVLKENGHRDFGIMQSYGPMNSNLFRIRFSHLINDLFRCPKEKHIEVLYEPTRDG